MREDAAFTATNSFERIAVAALSLATGGLLAFLAIKGPLVLGQITYKTHGIINNQLMGQDVINLVLLSPISIIGGITLLLRKPDREISADLNSSLSHLLRLELHDRVGMEFAELCGEQRRLYISLSLHPDLSAYRHAVLTLAVVEPAHSRFSRKGLATYSAVFTLFLLVFASMWMKEIVEVMQTGTARAYDIAPTAFWLVRVFDLDFQYLSA